MEEALVTRLIAAPVVAQLAGEQVSWFEFRRGERGGRVLLSEISDGREYSHDGATGLDGPRVQIQCLADDPDTALALAKAVRAVMESGDDIENVRFHPAMQVGSLPPDSEKIDGGVVIYRVSRDFQFYHEEI